MGLGIQLAKAYAMPVSPRYGYIHHIQSCWELLSAENMASWRCIVRCVPYKNGSVRLATFVTEMGKAGSLSFALDSEEEVPRTQLM